MAERVVADTDVSADSYTGTNASELPHSSDRRAT